MTTEPRNAEQAAGETDLHAEIKAWYDRYHRPPPTLPGDLPGAIRFLLDDDVYLRHKLGAIGELKMDLKKYGRHQMNCPAGRSAFEQIHGWASGPCECGWENALRILDAR